MPELPEVELNVRRLREWLPVGSRFIAVTDDDNRYMDEESYSWLCDHGRSLAGPVQRVGKFIVFWFGGLDFLTSHLAMSGYWDTAGDPWTFDYVEGGRTADGSDARLRFWVETPAGLVNLRFHDQRKFGKLYVGPPKTRVGPEIISTGCQSRPQGIRSGEGLRLALERRPSWPIKQALMEQTLVAGLGNIYASEALYMAGVNPLTPVRDVPDWDWLFAACQEQLISAIIRKLDYSGLYVYRRELCRKDGFQIESVDVAGRTSWFCPACQPQLR